MKKTIVAVALAVIFIMALAVPAFAQVMTHGVTYEMDGVIDYKRQAGHACNTGGVHKQVIAGSGEMSKESSIHMVRGKLEMSDTNDYVAGETALTVTSVIELCAPPKYTYEDAAGNTAVVHPWAMYGWSDQDGVGISQPYYKWGETPAGNPLFFGRNYDMAQSYGDWEALTGQIWAVQVQADPGFSGNLHQDFTAAYGPYRPDADSEGWWFVDGEGDQTNVFGNMDTTEVGSDYVGNYFTIDQHARTSMGEVKRYIDVSSPWSHAYLMEDMSVVGKSDIQESFAMHNLPPGADVPGDWWDLF